MLSASQASEEGHDPLLLSSLVRFFWPQPFFHWMRRDWKPERLPLSTASLHYLTEGMEGMVGAEGEVHQGGKKEWEEKEVREEAAMKTLSYLATVPTGHLLALKIGDTLTAELVALLFLRGIG